MYIIVWKEKDHGSCALLLDGARRVGKSYIAEWFGKKEYRSYLLIDFAHLPEEVRNIFEHDIADFDMFFHKLSAYYRKILYNRESLIIFDEVQIYTKDVLVKEEVIHLPIYMAMFLWRKLRV